MTENVDIVTTPVYDPAYAKRPPITVGVLDDPIIRVCVNRRWATVIVDALARYAMTDAWQGTDDDTYAMQSAVTHIMAMFGYPEDCVIDCNDLLDCLDDPGIIEKIIEKLNEGASASDDMVAGTASSDLDCVWGACIAMMDYMFAEVTGILDIVDSATGILDGIGDIVDVFTPIYPGAVGLYNASANVWEIIATATTAVIRALMTQAAKEDLACSLFCSVVDGGDPYTLTRAIWRGWLSDEFGSATITEPLHFIIGGLFYEMDVPVIGKVALISEAYLYQRYALALGDNCNDDWETLCDCGWCQFIDLTGGSLPTGVSISRGAHVPGTGIQSTYSELAPSQFNQAITVTVTLPATAHITSVRRVGVLSGERTSAPNTELDYVINPDPVVRVEGDPGAFDVTANDDVTAATSVIVYVLGGGSGDENWLYSIEICGLEANPYT